MPCKDYVPAYKSILLIGIFLCTVTLVPALDFSLLPGGFAFIPAGQDNKTANDKKIYAMGGGGDLGFELDFAGIFPNSLGLGYTLGLNAGIQYNSLKSPAEGIVQLYTAGGTAALSYFPHSRILTRIHGALGAYQSLIANEYRNKAGLWWKAGGCIGFRFTPALILSAGSGWLQYQSTINKGSGFNSGVYAGLTLHINFEAGPGSGMDGTSIMYEQDQALYPALYSLYRQYPAGTLYIRNNENAEIRNVRVSFRAGNYSTSEYQCGTLPLIAKGKQIEIPLYADFSNEILSFTNTGRISGEIIIRYDFLGKEKLTAHAVSVQILGQNSYPEDEPQMLAAFVSPNSPELLEFAKNISGLAGSHSRTGINKNMEFAVWMLEGIRSAGIRKTDDFAAEAQVQFPVQTLVYKTGSAIEIGLLYAGTLAATGIPTAFIPLENDFIVACNLQITETSAKTLFNNIQNILQINGEIWLPLSMNAFNQGFMQSWSTAINVLNNSLSDDAGIDFFIMTDIWQSIPPAPLPAQDWQIPSAPEKELEQGANLALQQYIDRELVPKLRQMQAQISSNPTATAYNQLGLMLMRTGRMGEAKTAYERAANMGSVSAMTNRANLAMIEKDYRTAEQWFRSALARDNKSEPARQGLEKVSAYLER